MFPIDFCHIPVSIIKRSAGRSAVAAAAYRSGTKLTNEWDGMTHDYTLKGGIVHAEIMLPAHAPPEFADRSILWLSLIHIFERPVYGTFDNRQVFFRAKLQLVADSLPLFASSRMISGLKYRSTGSPQTLINWIITGRLGIAP